MTNRIVIDNINVINCINNTDNSNFNQRIGKYMFHTKASFRLKKPTNRLKC